MSRLKKLVKIQSHQQFALQQLATDSRVSEDMKQFHSEQVQYADRNGVAKSLNFLLGLIQNAVIPTSDQIRSQVSKLVSLLRIRDELELHELIHKRENGIGEPLKLLRECPIEFPHWDEIFVLLKMKKYSVTFTEDHRARQDLIASILRREADIDRKKAADADFSAISQAQKAAADQVLMQKSLETAREKEQQALEAAKAKEHRVLDAAREKEQRALDIAKEKERKAFEKEEHIKFLQQQQHEAHTAKELKHQQVQEEKDRKSFEKEESIKFLKQQQNQPHVTKELIQQQAQLAPLQKEDTKIKVPNEDSNIQETIQDSNKHETTQKKIDGGNVFTNLASCTLTEIVHEQSSSSVATKESKPFQDLNPGFNVEMEQLPPDFIISELCPPGDILQSSPCQSPKSGESPRPIDIVELQEATIHSSDFQLSVPSEGNSANFMPAKQKNPADSEISSPESILTIPVYGPWRPFVSSSRFLPPVDASEINISPYEMALNLSCLAAVRSFPVLHGTSTSNASTRIPSIDNAFAELRVPKHLGASSAVPQFHHIQANAKLLEDMNFEEVQVDRALRSLRRCTERSFQIGINMCAYDEILLHQRKLMSLLLPVMQQNGEQRPNTPSFKTRDLQSTSHHDLFVAPRHEEFFSNTNRLPLKTNLAAQRRQVMLAKCSGSKVAPAEMLSSSPVDILHLESMAKMISNHSRGDPTLWKSAKRNIELPLSQTCTPSNKICEGIIGEVIGTFGSSNYAARSLPLTNFAQKIKSSLNRSFRERYSVAGRSEKR